MSFSSYHTQQEFMERLTDLEVTVEILIRELPKIDNPVRRQTLLNFADRVRQRNARPPEPTG